MPSTIQDVPNEVLAEIFGYVLDEVPLRPVNVNGVALVCKHWRDVVTSDSRFWRHIDLGHALWTAVCLKRSKRSTLTVKARCLFYQDAAARIEPLMPETHRIEHISLAFSGPEASRCLQDLLKNDLPSLRSLTLNDLSLSLHVGTILPPSCFLFRFPGLAHRLTRLELAGISFPTLDFPVVHVIDLALRRMSFYESCLPLVTTLANLPQLQRLELDDVCPKSKQPPTTSAQLPYLTKLIIRDLDPQSCAVLLDAIDFPSGVVPRIACRGSGTTSFAPLSRKCPYISDRVSPARLPIRELHVSHGFFDQRYRASLSARTQAIMSADNLKFYQFDDTPDDLQEFDEVFGLKPVVLKNVCDRLDLRQLDTLVLNADADFQYEYLPQLRNVSTLTLFGRLQPFVSLLRPRITPIDSSDTGFPSNEGDINDRMPFPKLDTIWIIRGMTNAIAADLADVLTRRQKNGHKVRKLVTSAGATSVDCCRLLESLVRVHWLDHDQPSFPLSTSTKAPLSSPRTSSCDLLTTKSLNSTQPSDGSNSMKRLPPCLSYSSRAVQTTSLEPTQPSAADHACSTQPLSSPPPPNPAPFRPAITPSSSIFFCFGIILAMLPQLFAILIALRLHTYDNPACLILSWLLPPIGCGLSVLSLNSIFTEI